MLDTFKSEARMFRVVVAVVIAAAGVIALTLATEELYGVLLAVGLLAFWIGWVWGGRAANGPGASAGADGGASTQPPPRPPVNPPGS